MNFLHVQAIEYDRPCQGEFVDVFESVVIHFEAENACWPAAYRHPPPFCGLVLHPTSASAYSSLLQRQIGLYREVLTATSKNTEDILSSYDNLGEQPD